MDTVTTGLRKSTLVEQPVAVTPPRFPPRALVAGMLGAVALLTFYLGLITLAQGWEHATAQLSLDRWYVTAVTLGFGTQVALYTWLRALRTSTMATGGVVVSTSTSTAAMLACCAHHVTDVAPVLGLSGAAIFLNDYKTELLWIGITMNAFGVAYMTREIRAVRRVHQARCRAMPHP